jgi:hypothetical protein
VLKNSPGVIPGMHVAVFVGVTVTFVPLLELFLLHDRPAEHRDASAG